MTFDPNVEPCYNAIRQGVQRDSLGVMVACMNRASIWRTKEISHNVSLGSSTTKEFYLAAELRGHRSLVRDVAWAAGDLRGFDVVATACRGWLCEGLRGYHAGEARAGAEQSGMRGCLNRCLRRE